MKKYEFKHLGLSKESLDAVADMGFKTPTEIQQESIPHILEGRDVIGHSRTGTGKTMAFGLPAIEIVDDSQKETQALILCPTRELAEQATGEIQKASVYKKELNVVAIYGGASMPNQMKQLKRGAQIVVGTPGRIMDHMRRGTLVLDNLKLLVLDEADEMLNMGFREDIETVLEDTPESTSMVLFSATMSKGIMRLTKNYQTDAKIIKAVDDNLTVATVTQWHIHVKKINKTMAVDALINYHQPKLTLIFCNTKRMVDELVDALQHGGISAVALHGDLNQNARNRVMSSFRTGVITVLVATDVAARGIDVDDVELVINYDIPQDDEYYVHRIGRTGRAGREGKAVTLVSGTKEKKRLYQIERYANVKIPPKQLPSKKDIDKIRNESFVDKFAKDIEKDTDEQYYTLLDTLIENGYSARQVAATLLRMELDKSSAKPKAKIENDSVASGAKERNMVRFFINVGKKDRVSPGDIVGCIVGEAKIKGVSIGKVDMYDMFSFVEVQQQFKNQVLDAINHNDVRIRNRKISIEVAKAKR